MTRIASRWSSEARLGLLVSPGFVAALVLLSLNDRVLKAAYPGLVTGKLSDFAGLFAFTIVLIALRPPWTRAIGAAVALMFACWKSPLSQSAIDAWNAALPYHIGRVVDATDLVALVSVFAAIAYARHLPRRTARPTVAFAVMTGSIVVFGGSFGSTPDVTTYSISSNDPSATYGFAFPPSELAQRLDDTGLFHGQFLLTGGPARGYVVRIDNDCRTASIEVNPLFSGTGIRLKQLSIEKRCGTSSQNELRERFDKEVAERLLGMHPPAPATSLKGVKSVEYPLESAPTLTLAGSLSDAVQRLYGNGFFAHEYHDGVFQLGQIACYGRFRMTEDVPNNLVVVTGIGYSTPCFSGESQDCLARLFRSFLGGAEGPTPTIALGTPASGLCAGDLFPLPRLALTTPVPPSPPER